MSTFAEAWGRGWLRSAIIWLFAVVIVLPLSCVCVFIPMWLVLTQDADIWVLIVPLGLFGLILFGGALVAIVWTVAGRSRGLDAAFKPLGLTGSAYLGTFRQYHGTVQGRPVSVYLTRGPMLDLRVRTSLQTRLGIAETRAVPLTIARLFFNRQPLALADPVLGGLSVFALDEDWTRVWLANSEVKAVLQRLVANESSFLMWQVVLEPGELLLRLHHSKGLFRHRITPAEAQQWLDDLLTLVRIAESLPAPLVTAQVTAPELTARSLRQANPAVRWLVGLGVLFGIMLVVLLGTAIVLGIVLLPVLLSAR